MTLFKRIIIALAVLFPLSGMCAAMKVGDVILGNSLIVTNNATVVLSATNGVVSIIGLRLANFNSTSNFVWTCTNATTGQGEWRTTAGFQPASANLTNWSLIPTGAMANAVSTTFLTNWANAISNLAETKQLGSATLTNLSGTGAITNLFSLSLSNATIKPVVFGGVGSAAGMTNTTGQFYGLEAGAGTSLTPNGSNITLATTLTTVSTNANQFGASVQLTIKNLAFLTNANFFGATNSGDFTNDGKIFSTGTFTNGGAVNILGGVTNWGAVETRGNATNAGWLAIVGGFTNNGAMLIGGSITNAGRVDTAGGMTNYSSFKVLGTADHAGAVTNESRTDTTGGVTNWAQTEAKGTLYASSNLWVKAGQGTSNAWVGGRIFIDASTQTTNHSGAAAYTNLFTYTVPGNTLTNTGDELEFYLSGMMRLQTATTNGFKCIYGSQTIFDTGLNTASNCPWSAKIKITRTGLSAQRVEAVVLWNVSAAISSSGNGTISGYATNLVAAQANGATNIFVFQGESRLAAALTNDYRVISYWPGLN